jgi:addiction module RelE/StbE family toxin
MKVIWSREATEDRDAIFDYIEADNPHAAARMDELFDKASAMLAEQPKLGKEGVIPGTRELLAHRSYRLVYEVNEQTVQVLALVHTARQWPPVMGHR